MGCKPDPYKFTIVEREIVGLYTIVLARYEGCLSFRGEKLMLCDAIIPEDIETLDPHFMEGHHIIARFAPTNVGKELARLCAIRLSAITEPS